MEQDETVLQLPETDKREGNLGNREVFDQRNVLEAPEMFERTRSSEAPNDCGLRRRFVSAGEPMDTLSSAMSSGSASSDDSLKGFYGRESGNEAKRLGSISRKILEPEMPSRHQPSKSKKKKKKMTKGGASAGAKPIKTPLTPSKIIRQALETADEDVNTDAYPLFVIRDFIIYLIFMILVCFIALGPRGSAYNYYSDVLRGVVTKSYYNSSFGTKITFRQTKHHLDMWSFIVNVVRQVIYDKSPGDVVNRGLKILTENILFGVPQLRQLRVREQTCSPAPFFQTLYSNCADYYSEDIEDKNDFGPRTSSWRYVPPYEDKSYSTGKLSNYPQGGFVMNFTNEENFTMESIEELRQGSWVGFGTRAVFLDFALFNPNTHLFCVCKLIFEFPPYGGVLPSSRFWTLKLLRNTGAWDYFVLSCEIVFVCFTVYYTFEEAVQMFRLRGAYWLNRWNMLDLAIIALCYYAIICGFFSAVETKRFVERNVDNILSTNHVSFDRIVDIQSQSDISMEIVLFVVWLKIFKFSTLNKIASLVSLTVANTGAEITVVTLMMLSIIIGFAILGFVLFGSLLHAFRTVGVSVFTMIRLFTGGIHWNDDLSQHGLSDNWMLVYCIIFFLFARVLFLNVLIAILVNGFEGELRDYNELSNTATIGDVFREWFCWFLLLIGREKTVIEIYNKEIIKQDKRIYEALMKILRRHRYEGVEADLMLEKHRISYGIRIPKESMAALYDDIHVRNQLYLEVEGHTALKEQIEQVEKTVLVIDQTLMGLMTKVDMLTNRYIQKRATISPS